jgi:hypothetical protein
MWDMGPEMWDEKTKQRILVSEFIVNRHSTANKLFCFVFHSTFDVGR